LSEDLTVDALLNSEWKFYNDNGLLGVIGFNENGKITLYDNNNERTWTIDTQGSLVIKRGDGVVSTKFVHAYRDYFGKWHLEGRFLLTNNGWRHYIIQQ